MVERKTKAAVKMPNSLDWFFRDFNSAVEVRLLSAVQRDLYRSLIEITWQFGGMLPRSRCLLVALLPFNDQVQSLNDEAVSGPVMALFEPHPEAPEKCLTHLKTLRQVNWYQQRVRAGVASGQTRARTKHPTKLATNEPTEDPTKDEVFPLPSSRSSLPSSRSPLSEESTIQKSSPPPDEREEVFAFFESELGAKPKHDAWGALTKHGTTLQDVQEWRKAIAWAREHSKLDDPVGFVLSKALSFRNPKAAGLDLDRRKLSSSAHVSTLNEPGKFADE